MRNNCLKVPIGTLQNAAVSILDFYEEDGDLFDQVLNLLTTIKERGEWKGAGVDALIRISQNNKKTYANAMAELKDLATFLSDFIERISTEDSSIKSEIDIKMR